MIKGVIFSNQYVSSAAHASLFRMMVKDGIIRGCGFVFAPNQVSNAVQIMDGMFVLCGRVVEIQGQEIITTDATNTKPYIRIRGVIDMTKRSDLEAFEQFYFEVDPDRDYADNIADFDPLTKEDINSPQYSTTGKYEVEFAVLHCTNGKPTSTSRTMPSASGEGGSGETEGSGPPAFTYRGTLNGTDFNYTYSPDSESADHVDREGVYTVIDDGDDNWRVKFLTSGTLIVTALNGMSSGINVFLVGGGESGYALNGGAGGYTKTGEFTNVVSEMEYPIVVGAGGTTSSRAGGESSAFSLSAAGGGSVSANKGGSGSGKRDPDHPNYSSNGGSDGGDGENNPNSGQGSTTREFGESNGDLYAGGGGATHYGDTYQQGTGGAGGGGNSGYGGDPNSGGMSTAGTAGTANTGGGGGANNRSGAKGTSGGSGIVIIRNKRTA